jgi:hypothetical protein
MLLYYCYTISAKKENLRNTNIAIAGNSLKNGIGSFATNLTF